MRSSVERGRHDPIATALLLGALALFAWTHRHTFALPGFADDLGLLAEMPARVADGTLGADLSARWTGALWPGSTMWRPLPYASFALDGALWGSAGGAWHVTNVVLHLINAALTGWLAASLLRAFTAASDAATVASQRLAAMAAAAMFLLAPWSPEVTLWLVGRFDGWVTSAALLATVAFVQAIDPTPPPRRRSEWALASIAAAAAAYASKESAVVLPIWLFILFATHWLTCRQRSPLAPSARAAAISADGYAAHRGRMLLGAHLVLASAYLLWRKHLFSGAATAVYGNGLQVDAAALLNAFLAHLAFPVGLASLASGAVLAASVVSVGLLVLLFVARPRGVALTAVAATALAGCVLFGLALYLPLAPGTGEGYRLYYLATPGLVIAVAAALIVAPRWAVIVATAVLLLSLAIWQNAVAREWTRAGREMTHLLHALPAAAAAQTAGDYTLLLVPDMRGHVPFGRNAQGALPVLADARQAARDRPSSASVAVPTLSRLILFTPPQIAEWHQLARESVVPAIARRAGRTDAPANPTQFACFDPASGTIRLLGIWSADTSLDVWRLRWLRAAEVNCPSLLND
ncbi:MAG: hypothetical protein JNL19_13910 [Burkholderiales bacterium]|nr:hypothetical protein [Burkholderiales bacterium]